MSRAIWIAAVAAAGCADVVDLPEVAYDDRHGEATMMDVSLPADDRPDRPAVLLIHGGGWRHYSKEVYVDHRHRLADAGYVVAAINYRLVPDGAYPALIQDSLCALAFLRAQADAWGLDPDRVAVAGYSAGGHIASLLGVAADAPELQPDCDAGPTFAPRAVISGAGPTDMREMPQVPAVTEFMGGTIDEVPDDYDVASPIHHVAPGAPPYLFIHGTDDAFVDISHSERMRDALVAAGSEARLLALAGGGHLINPGPDLGDAAGPIVATDVPEAWAASLDFLDRHLNSAP